MSPPLDGQTYGESRPEPLELLLLGYLHGEQVDGLYVVVGLFREGDDFRLTSAGRSHTCLPSVEDIEGVKREAFHVYGIWRWVFEPNRGKARLA